ncbi:unnamed protein product [Schistosoma curassoni]|uniref:DHC_N2 domain-containing protein n=1 Tax=Schistosoma curassoni TaxID=6186 RepID=A0A183KUN6_9TREM|nr:unnamed protein product [Schistosoma curassoni]
MLVGSLCSIGSNRKNCEISHVCHASEDLKVRMEKLFEGISKNQEHMVGLIPKVSPLHDVAYPVIEECEALTKQLRILEFAEHLSFLEDFECLLKKLNFPVIVSEVLEEEGLQTWCDDDLQLFSNDFQALSTFDISYPFMNRLLTLSPNYVP